MALTIRTVAVPEGSTSLTVYSEGSEPASGNLGHLVKSMPAETINKATSGKAPLEQSKVANIKAPNKV